MRPGSLASLRIEPRLRRYASAGLAMGLAASLIALPLSMLDGYLRRSGEIEDLRLDLDRLRQRSAGAEARPRPASSASEDVAGVFATNTEGAGAHIQARLRNLAAEFETGEIRVEGVRVLPPLSEGGITAIRVSAALTAPGSRIFDVINTLEASDPPIVIDSLRILSRSDASPARARGLAGAELPRGELTLVLRVYTLQDTVLPRPSGPSERRASGVERMP